MTVLKARQLCKSYSGRSAVEDLDLTARSGEIIGLVGPNGSGKTTTLSMLVGRLAPDSGEVLLDGTPVKPDHPDSRKTMGWAPQTISVYPEFAGRENLRFFGSLYGLKGNQLARNVEEVLGRFRLTEFAERPCGTYSEGMKRRLNLALAFVHHPRVVVLDEPTVGLDVHTRVVFLEFLQQLRDAGTLIVYAGHYLEEAEHLCDRLLLLDRGRLVDQGPLKKLLSRRKDRVEIQLRCSPEGLPDRFRQIEDSQLRESDGGCSLSLPGPGPERSSSQLREVLGGLEGAGIEIERILAQPPTLEEVILEMEQPSESGEGWARQG